MKQTSRQRVIAALEHKQPDEMPIDFGATRSTSINVLAYRSLIEYLGFKENVKVFDFKQFLALPSESILSLFQSDCIPLFLRRPTAGIAIDCYREYTYDDGSVFLYPKDFKPERLPDGSEVIKKDGIPIMKRPKDGLYFDDCYHPLAEADEKLPGLSLPFLSDSDAAYLKSEAERMFREDNRAIVANSGISVFERGIKDFGYEEFLVKVYTEPETIKFYLEKLTAGYLGYLDIYLNAVGNYVQVIQLNDDLGMQTGPLIAPEIYKELFAPYHKRIISYIKSKHPHLFVLLHSCGSIFDIIPTLIDAGFDAINPVQTNAAKMEPAILKKEFGKDITFWGGGCSTQTTLTYGTLEEIEAEVKRSIEIFAPNGGFVFCQVHNIQNNVSPERILKLYETAVSNR